MTHYLGTTPLSDRQARVLAATIELSTTDPDYDERVVTFHAVSVETGMKPRDVRHAMRALFRKGLVERSPAFDQDLRIVGSGHIPNPQAVSAYDFIRAMAARAAKIAGPAAVAFLGPFLIIGGGVEIGARLMGG